MAAALKRFEGAFALAVLVAGRDDLLLAARRGSPLAVGYGAGEMYVGSDALALAPFTRKISYLEDGDWAAVTAARGAGVRRRRQAGAARGARDGADRGADRQGQPPPLHAQGDPRAAGDRRRHAARVSQPGDPAGRAAGPAVRLQGPAQADHRRVRHVVVCRDGGEVLVRRAGAAAGRGRHRLGVPLPRPAVREGRCGAVHLAVGRDDRHAVSAAPRQEPGPAHRGDRQRAGELDRARGRRGVPDPCRPRDRRRVDQGVHRAIDRAGVPGAGGGEGARHARCEACRRAGGGADGSAGAPGRGAGP